MEKENDTIILSDFQNCIHPFGVPSYPVVYSILGLSHIYFSYTSGMSLSSLVLIRKYVFKVKFCIIQTPPNPRQGLLLLSKEIEKLLGYIFIGSA